MKVIILAAGQGIRLRPYTDNKPKCMVMLAGKALLHWQLMTLRSLGLQDITVVGGYLSTQLDAPDTKLILNPNYANSNMVSTLFCARELFTPGEDLLICYGDIVYQRNVLQSVIACESELCLAADRQWQKLWSLRMENPLDDAETFQLGPHNKVLELGKKPHSYDDVQAQYMGLIKIRGDCVEKFDVAYHNLDRDGLYDSKDFDNMYMTSFIQHLIDNEWDVSAALVNSGWLEVDTADELEHYNQLIKQGDLSSLFDLDKINAA
ncbi:Putative sugar nucleotidyltransferase [hydrothermal vent metagenome]|uniref:Sugar nucleotidyltransferase n=1 Tax=hydrothermal vent metagenome TaxID=652676 RepID=A0A3B0Y6F5_9ZZZZ